MGTPTQTSLTPLDLPRLERLPQRLFEDVGRLGQLVGLDDDPAEHVGREGQELLRNGCCIHQSTSRGIRAGCTLRWTGPKTSRTRWTLATGSGWPRIACRLASKWSTVAVPVKTEPTAGWTAANL